MNQNKFNDGKLIACFACDTMFPSIAFPESIDFFYCPNCHCVNGELLNVSSVEFVEKQRKENREFKKLSGADVMYVKSGKIYEKLAEMNDYIHELLDKLGINKKKYKLSFFDKIKRRYRFKPYRYSKPYNETYVEALKGNNKDILIFRATMKKQGYMVWGGFSKVGLQEERQAVVDVLRDFWNLNYPDEF